MNSQIQVSLGYRDPEAAMRFLASAFGFEQGPIHDDDSGHIHHAEMSWPGGGKVHLHTAEGSSVAGIADRAAADGGYPGVSIHIDVEDPDPFYTRALEVGALVVRKLQDSPHGVGTRGFIVADPEGLYWSLGTPLPELVRTSDGRWVPAAESNESAASSPSDSP